MNTNRNGPVPTALATVLGRGQQEMAVQVRATAVWKKPEVVEMATISVMGPDARGIVKARSPPDPLPLTPRARRIFRFGDTFDATAVLRRVTTEQRPRVLPVSIAIAEQRPRVLPGSIAIAEQRPRVLPVPIAIAEQRPRVLPGPIAITQEITEVAATEGIDILLAECETYSAPFSGEVVSRRAPASLCPCQHEASACTELLLLRAACARLPRLGACG